MMSHISLLYILLLSLLSIPASPIISPSFHWNQLQVYCRRPGSLKDTTDTPSRESLHYLQLFSFQEKWYPIYFFLLLLFVFHDLCFLFSAMSSSLFLWLSEPQLSAVLLFEVPLFLVVDAESGYPVGDGKEKEHCLLYNSCSYVSLVKINSGKLEARASRSLAKHVHPVEGNSGFPFRVYSESVPVLFDCRGKASVLSSEMSPVLYMLLSTFVTCKLMSNDFKHLRKLVLRTRSRIILSQMPLGLILSYI